MKRRGFEPDSFTYNSMISSCVKGGEGKRALDILEEMRIQGLVPYVITYSAAMSAPANGGEWERALELSMRSRTEA